MPNGLYTERGIKEFDGYGSERWRVEPEFAVRVAPELGRLGVLMEPASIVAKVWDQIERIGDMACSRTETVLVTGAGPIGLLAALLARQRGLESSASPACRRPDGDRPRIREGLAARAAATRSSCAADLST